MFLLLSISEGIFADLKVGKALLFLSCFKISLP